MKPLLIITALFILAHIAQSVSASEATGSEFADNGCHAPIPVLSVCEASVSELPVSGSIMGYIGVLVYP